MKESVLKQGSGKMRKFAFWAWIITAAVVGDSTNKIRNTYKTDPPVMIEWVAKG